MFCSLSHNKPDRQDVPCTGSQMYDWERITINPKKCYTVCHFMVLPQPILAICLLQY